MPAIAEETRRKTMVDKRINKALWDLVDSLHETNQAVADNFVAIQDRNLRFAQNRFLIGIEAVEAQTENARQLKDQWAQQLPKQQEAFQRLMSASLHVYMNFLCIPFSFYQVQVSVTEASSRRAIQFAEHVTRQVEGAVGTVAQLEQAQVWTFEHPLQEVESDRPVLLRVKGPGIVHAGVNREGKWITTYDVPLEEVSPGIWEAYLSDPGINEFTFIWHDSDKPGMVHWEGKNYQLLRQPAEQRRF
jgi:hypothetical protein